MVVWLTGIQYLHVPVVQRSLTIVRPSRAFHDLLKQVAGEVYMTPGADSRRQ